MNNFIWVYRVEHRQLKYQFESTLGATQFYLKLCDFNASFFDIGIGPYAFTTIHKNPISRPELVTALENKLRSNEPRERHYKRNVMPNKTLSTSFGMTRPGIFEDPILKDKINSGSTFLKNIENKKTKFLEGFVFCFDSICQFGRWFDDKEELALLKKSNFVLVKRKVPIQNVVVGHAQSVMKCVDSNLWIKSGQILELC